jgi:hypothetical protein
MRIRRLSEEIGFSYTNKEEEVAQDKTNVKKAPKLGLLNNILKPIAKSAFEAGKSGITFDEWWNDFAGGDQADSAPKQRNSMGFIANRERV